MVNKVCVGNDKAGYDSSSRFIIGAEGRTVRFRKTYLEAGWRSFMVSDKDGTNASLVSGLIPIREAYGGA